MLTYDLTKRDGQPLYLYLYSCIKSDIEQGVLRANEKLPSKRALAEHLGLSAITVQNAYAQLLSEGHIYALERSGYYVSELEGPAPAPAREREPIRPAEPGAERKFLADFCASSVRAEDFPFSEWSARMREVLSEHDSELLRRIPNAGVPKLRAAIADFLSRWRGMAVSPEQIIIGAGTEYLYGLIIKLLGKDKVYAVEDPGYATIAKIYGAEGVERRYIALDGSGLSVDALTASGADVVHISPSHHFPTGIVMPIRRRQEILSWACAAPGRYVIEDDYDSEFRLVGKAIPTLQSIDARGKVLYVNTFSKSISPAIRVSYMVLPHSLLERYRERLGFYSCTVSAIEQYTLAKFIEGGHFERHINRLRRSYRIVRDGIIDAVKRSPLRGRAEILEESSGLHFIMKLKTDLSDAELVAEARRRGVNISCLSQYCRDSRNARSSVLILNYSGVDAADAEKAMDILYDIIR